MMLAAAKLALAPLLILQGRRVRRMALRLPEAAGEREAVLGEGSARLRLLSVGDSATAGVGAAPQREALAGRLAEHLAAQAGARVHWRLVARSGATTAEALQLLDESFAIAVPPAFAADGSRQSAGVAAPVAAALQAVGGAAPAGNAVAADAGAGIHPHVGVVALGVNDVTGQEPLRRWLGTMESLARRLERQHGVGLLVVSGLPPMHLFPALPQPLRWYLGACARRYDRALRDWAARRPATLFVPMPAMTDPALMGEDGFHPGPPAYAAWAEVLAQALLGALASGRAGPGSPAADR